MLIEVEIDPVKTLVRERSNADPRLSDILGHVPGESAYTYLHIDNPALQNAAARKNRRLRTGLK